jgi:hypothetical protein
LEVSKRFIERLNRRNVKTSATEGLGLRARASTVSPQSCSQLRSVHINARLFSPPLLRYLAV